MKIPGKITQTGDLFVELKSPNDQTRLKLDENLFFMDKNLLGLVPSSASGHLG
jgi:hypothetical protein